MASAHAEPTGPAIIYLIDDDTSMQRAFTRLMRSAGLDSVAFASVDEFLGADFRRERACVVADVHMPGISALDLPTELRKRGLALPVIFITADYSDETRERIRQAGGCSFFRKPIDDQALLDTIRWVIDNPRPKV